MDRNPRFPSEAFLWDWRLAIARRIAFAGPADLARVESTLLFDCEGMAHVPPQCEPHVPRPASWWAERIDVRPDSPELASFLVEVLVALRMARDDEDLNKRPQRARRGYR